MIKKLTSQQVDSRSRRKDSMVFLGTLPSITFPLRLRAFALKKPVGVAHA